MEDEDLMSETLELREYEWTDETGHTDQEKMRS